MKFADIIDSINTDIYSKFYTPKDLICEIMSKFYDEGFDPNYLLVNSADIKLVKNIFKEYKRRDLGKYIYETDFGLLHILQNKEQAQGVVKITDKY